MSVRAIKVEGVGKRYHLGEGHGEKGRFLTGVGNAFWAPFRKLRGSSGGSGSDGDQFWALRDVSLELEEGHMLGLIGANGAGKSTLLKLLARVTYPTEGQITLRGQVGSLLEVGTGFHPELTGRENIFLNGAILGMRRREIAARFDEIVEFSGIEQFIDTPVKRYSSGMFVRLAFSVAAHLQPEILLVDEVLAVGDAEFQAKCLKKLESVRADEGRTIVFVSHGLNSMRKLCDRVVLIEKGRVKADGPADSVIADYMERVRPVQHGGVSVVPPDATRLGTGEARITRVSLLDDERNPIESVLYGQPFSVEFELEAEKMLENCAFIIGISSADGTRFLTSYSIGDTGSGHRVSPGKAVVSARFDITLLPGEFAIDIGIADIRGTGFDHLERVMSFTARNLSPEGVDDHYPWDTIVGFVRPEAEWALDGQPSGKQPLSSPTSR